MTKRRAGILVVVLAALLVVGCEAERTPAATTAATLSVDEYVSWCNSFLQNVTVEHADNTHGKAREGFSKALQEY